SLHVGSTALDVDDEPAAYLCDRNDNWSLAHRWQRERSDSQSKPRRVDSQLHLGRPARQLRAEATVGVGELLYCSERGVPSWKCPEPAPRHGTDRGPNLAN